MQRAFPGVCGLVLALLILAAASPAPARPLLAAAPTKVLRYSGVGTGGDTWKQHFESHDSPPSVVGDSNGADLGTFTFAFTVSRATGRVVGRGQGHYTTATWHMQGQNGSEGTFSCDVPVKTTSFRVVVAGRAVGSHIRLSLTLPNAYESNDELFCGGNFYADAQQPFNTLDPSLKAVGGRGLVISKAHPQVLNLAHESTSTEDDTSARPPTTDQNTDDDAWTITIRRK